MRRKFAITHAPTDPRAGFDDNRVGKSRIVDRDSPKFRETVARAESEEGTAEPCPSPTPTDDQREGRGFQSRATAAWSDDWSFRCFSAGGIPARDRGLPKYLGGDGPAEDRLRSRRRGGTVCCVPPGLIIERRLPRDLDHHGG